MDKDKKGMNFDNIVEALTNPSSKHTMLYINLGLTVVLIVMLHIYCRSRSKRNANISVNKDE